MQNEIFVEKVDQKNRIVDIRVLNTVFTFKKINNKIKVVSKYSVFSQVYDPSQLWVPKNYFLKACAIAGAILNERRRNEE